jgi:hypothetical protein
MIKVLPHRPVRRVLPFVFFDLRGGGWEVLKRLQRRARGMRRERTRGVADSEELLSDSEGQ